MQSIPRFVLALLVLAGGLGATCSTPSSVAPATVDDHAASPCGDARISGLPLPSSLPLADYERVLYEFVMNRRYTDLGWCADKKVRDTGPWIQGGNYGTHPAVRIWYSPEMMYWLTGDPGLWPEGERSGEAPRREPRSGTVPDGAMIVKEMFVPPAAIYEELQRDPKYRDDPAALDAMIASLVSAWTIMVRDSHGSADGWFWAGPGAPAKDQSVEDAIEGQLDDYSHPLWSSFGAPCLRCHASASSELTFSTTSNIAGFTGEPIRYRVDDSWRTTKLLDVWPLSRLSDDAYARSLFELPQPLRPWTRETVELELESLRQHMRPAPSDADEASTEKKPHINQDFLSTFPQIEPVAAKSVSTFPSQWADHVVPAPEPPSHYITSDNCLGCHGGLGGAPYGVTMFVKTGPGYGEGYNVSEYGEWRWSPMGLAGRDPIFHAQIESEMALIERDATVPGRLHGPVDATQSAVRNLCLTCHGAMGKRQLAIDAAQNDALDPDFQLDYFHEVTPLTKGEPSSPYARYGNLAREGISCTVCHHITAPTDEEVDSWNPPDGWVTGEKDLAWFLFHNTTGRYERGEPDVLHGPFDDVATLPMESALGITPRGQAYTSNSDMCGTCHTINLPNIGMTEDRFPILTAAETVEGLRSYPHSIEQATYLEWKNSAFAATEPDGSPAPTFRSCQDCHMPSSIDTPETGEIDLVTRIASIMDTTYPESENTATAEEIDVPMRGGDKDDLYRRHEHVGLNVFLIEMVRQFPDILGVAETDYMTSATTGDDLAIASMVRQAQKETVDLAVSIDSVEGSELTTTVTVTNKTGHRLPSGVAFRRVFLELLVLDGDRVVWGSGRTNGVGVIVDGDGKPLSTEFLPDGSTYQPHHQVITREDQVQIYEELNLDADGDFTTSFVHRVVPAKDNRLLPKGWRDSSTFRDRGALTTEFMKATDPEVDDDPDYFDQGDGFPGTDTIQYRITLPSGIDPARLSVRATIHHQSIPPYWLADRFETAPDRPATRRLHYLASHLDLEGTPAENWKLPLVSATAKVTPPQNRK